MFTGLRLFGGVYCNWLLCFRVTDCVWLHSVGVGCWVLVAVLAIICLCVSGSGFIVVNCLLLIAFVWYLDC